MVHHYILRHIDHDSREFALGTLQEFYRILGITPKDWMPRTDFESYFSDLLDMQRDIPSSLQAICHPRFTQVDGNIRGSISYVSSSLDTAIDPSLIAELLSDIPGVEHLYTEGKLTGEVDLVTSFEQTPSYATTTDTYSWKRPRGLTAPLAAGNVVKELQVAQTIISRSPGTNAGQIKVAFEDTSLICFVPATARVDDLICQFSASNTLVVVRRLDLGLAKPWEIGIDEDMGWICGGDGGDSRRLMWNEMEEALKALGVSRENALVGAKYQIIGRAVNFLASPPTKPFPVDGIFGAESPTVGRCVMRFFLDAVTFLQMTVASSNPDLTM
jgi:hypothetical protein